MADETVKVEIVGDASGAVDAANKASSAVSDSVGQMKSDLGSLGDSGNASMASLGTAFEELRSKFQTGLQITGIGVAIAGLDALKGLFEKFGDEAIQVENMSAILGLTVEQFQGLKEAAEETGVPIEMLARSSERLRSTLYEAQNGSAGAIVKLKELGLTTAEIGDKSRDFNSVLLELSQRLKDPATAQDTLNALIAIFGTRAALAAEALKKYSGEATGVNALNAQQNTVLAETGIWWKKLGTTIANTTEKILAYTVMAERAATTGWKPGLLGDVTSSEQLAGNVAAVQQSQDQMVEITVHASKQITAETLEDLKQQISETRSGTEQRLALIKQFYQESLQYYGTGSAAPVRAAQVEMINSERELADKRKNFLEEWASYYQDTTLRNSAAVDEQNTKLSKSLAEQQKQLQNFFDEWGAYYQQLTLKNSASEDAASAKLYKSQNEVLNKLIQQWKGFSDGIARSFTTAIESIFNRTQTFGQAMRSLFTSVFDQIISKLAQWAAEWVEKLIITKIANQTAAVSQVSSNAGVAASAAMGSVAAIPFVGWAMAPEVGASTFAEAMAFMPSAAAAGGYDIPSGVNPVTQLHQSEMVLPATLADGIRGMVAGGGGRGGGEVHIHAQSLDSGTVNRMLVDKKGVIAKALREHVRGRR